jgi:biotin carboxyl carrier protein
MTDVLAEITANVWQIRCEVGQAVAAGHELVILESMKMEIPVEAPCAGTVTAIHVEEGGQVTEGALVATIDES